jgi:putative PEP-CTERM system TPR-repeat lipoprotein
MPRNNARRSLTAAVVTGALVLGAGVTGCGKTETTASLLADAKQYQAKGDNKAALIQLKNAVAKTPDDGEARFALGSYYLEHNDNVSAEKELRKAHDLKFDDKRVLPLLARASMGMGQAKNVLTDITPEAAKTSAQLSVLRGDALMGTNEPQQAKEAYDQALALQPGSGSALIGQARYAMAHKDIEGAQRFLDEAVAKDGSNPDVYMARGALFGAQGKTDDALKAYGEALKINPRLQPGLIERAYIEINTKKFAEAKADIDAAGKVQPGLIVTYAQALLDFSQGNNTAARDGLLKILRAAPDHLPSTLLSGAVDLNLGSNQQAEQKLRKYVEAVPGNLYARKLLGQAQLKLGHADDVLLTVTPAMRDHADDVQLLVMAGEANMQLGSFAKAVDLLQNAAKLQPQAAPLRASLGMARMSMGDTAKGVADLEQAVALDPKAIRPATSLIQAYASTKQPEKALAAAQELVKQAPGDPQAYTLLGSLYLSKGDVQNARASLEKAVAIKPDFFPAVNNLAQLDMRDKNVSAARKRFEGILAIDKKNYAALASLAEISMIENKPADATAFLQKAVAENGDAVEPALTLAGHYLRIKEPAKAVELLRKYQTANATNANLLDMLGQAQMASNDLNGALESFSKLATVMPKSGAAQVHLAAVHAAMKNNTAAADDLRRAVDVQPDYAPARVAQAELAMRSGKPDEAIAIARQVQKRNDKNPLGFALEGEMQMFMKKPALAQAPFEKAFALSKSPQSLMKLASAMDANGKNAAALAMVQQYSREHPEDLLSAMYIANQQMAAKQFKPAIASLEAIQKRAPNNPAVLNNLAWTYQQDKDPRALATAQQAMKVAPESADVIDTTGWIMTEQGDAKGALPLLQKAASLAPASVEIRYHLAVALNKSGDKAGARKELTAVLSQNKQFAQIDDARALLNSL